MEVGAAKKITEVITLIYEDLQNTVIKTEFKELKDMVKELAEAQKRTEREVRNLARQVGGLSERLGGSLEDISYDVLPACLEKYYQIEVAELGRDFISVNGKVVEVNILGNGVDKNTGKRVTVIGEVKTNITLREVKRFVRLLEKVKGSIQGGYFLCYLAFASI